MSFTYKIIEHIATLSEARGESKQVNVISYNDTKPKVDIRNWFDDGKMGKGITLDNEEWAILGKCFDETTEQNTSKRIFDQISWLTKRNTDEYEINLGEFGVNVSYESELVLSSDLTSANYSIYLEADNLNLQKNIEFLNNANKYFSETAILANAYIDFTEGRTYIKIIGFIPFQLEIEEHLDSLYDFFSEYSNEINEVGTLSIKQLYIDNVIVIGDLSSCVHDNHKSEEILISVDFVDKTGSITRIETKAFYCKKCNLFFMRKHDYRMMKLKAGTSKMLCQEVEQEKYYKCPDFSEFNLNDHSILNAYGYNVNAMENLSNIQRQDILSGLIDRKILSKNRIASYLAHFIKLASSKKVDMHIAIQKWNSDRDFILDYQVGSRKKVTTDKIKVIKYIPTK